MLMQYQVVIRRLYVRPHCYPVFGYPFLDLCSPTPTDHTPTSSSSSSHSPQPLWRFTAAPADGRLLVYRSEDIRNISRLASSKVCGYVSASSRDLLPEGVQLPHSRDDDEEEGEAHLANSLNLQLRDRKSIQAGGI